MPTFTMAEFIEQHKLAVAVNDSVATRLIAKKLREAGYQHIRLLHNGVRGMVWTNDRLVKVAEFKAKLDEIKL